MVFPPRNSQAKMSLKASSCVNVPNKQHSAGVEFTPVCSLNSRTRVSVASDAGRSDKCTQLLCCFSDSELFWWAFLTAAGRSSDTGFGCPDCFSLLTGLPKVLKHHVPQQACSRRWLWSRLNPAIRAQEMQAHVMSLCSLALISRCLHGCSYYLENLKLKIAILR